MTVIYKHISGVEGTFYKRYRPKGDGRMKFKAKPKVLNYEAHMYDWLEEKMDDEGYVHGYYVDGYIVGEFVEVTNEYTHLEYWVPIREDTLKQSEPSE